MTLVPDIAPEIFRQRLLVEGYFTCALNDAAVSRFMVELAGALLRIRSLLALGEGIRRARSALPLSTLPGRGVIADRVPSVARA